MTKVQTFSRQGKGPNSSLATPASGTAVTLAPSKSNGGYNYRAAGKLWFEAIQDKLTQTERFQKLVSDCLANYSAVASYLGDFGDVIRYCINVDWFEATLEGSWLPFAKMGEPEKVAIFLNGDLVLERDPDRWNGTKHYQYCYRVYLYGEPVATVITHPRNAIMGQTSTANGTRALSQLRLENHVLYREGWLNIYGAILEGLNVQLNNITRLDISVDGGPFLVQYRDLVSGKYKKVGRAKHSCYFTEKDEIEGFYIGSRSSERYVRGYSKTSEIKQAGGHKTYITAAWEKANLKAWNKGEGEVQRLELVLRAKAIAQVDGFDVSRLEDDNYLAGLMRANLQKFYQFVDADELARTGNITRCARIEPVEWEYFGAEQLERLPTTKKPNIIWAVQRRIAFDMMEYFAKLDNDSVFGFNYELAKSYGVLEWFERKVPYWKSQQEFHAMMREEKRKAKEFAFIDTGRHRTAHELKTSAA